MPSIAKSYNNVNELPSQVRSSFDERDQNKWMQVYNELSNGSDDPTVLETARVGAWKAMVDAPSSLAVETWASVEVRDADGELVPIKTIESNSDRFIKAGGLMHDSHTNVPIGSAWAWEERFNEDAQQPGIVYYFNVYRGSDVFERARNDIIDGRKRAVSIGAEAPRGAYKCDDRGCYVERDVTDLYEISICETPANPLAGFIAIGDEIKKSHSGTIMKLRIKDMTVHQDYTTCPLQSCKHTVLTDVPNADVHISGRIVKCKGNEPQIFDSLMRTGYITRYDLLNKTFDSIPDYNVEDCESEALSNGWACDDGIGHTMLTRSMPEPVFRDWYSSGYIQKIGDTWCIRSSEVAKDDGAMSADTPGASNTVYGGKRRYITYPELESLDDRQHTAKMDFTDSVFRYDTSKERFDISSVRVNDSIIKAHIGVDMKSSAVSALKKYLAEHPNAPSGSNIRVNDVMMAKISPITMRASDTGVSCTMNVGIEYSYDTPKGRGRSMASGNVVGTFYSEEAKQAIRGER